MILVSFIATNEANQTVKWSDRGYWVSTLYKYQSLIYWIGYSVYFRSLTFFSAANPALHLGGMLDDTKTAIYDLTQEKYLPNTIVVTQHDDLEKELRLAQISFPLIVKPNVGFKGFMVRRIDQVGELLEIQSQFGNREMLIQEFMAHSSEYSIMCYRLKDNRGYGISSFVEKVMPFIIGDGQKSINELVGDLDNPFLKKELVYKKYEAQGTVILADQEKLVIDHVGNYARGSKFYDRAEQIDDALHQAIDDFFSEFDGLNFGRLDLKADSIEDIKQGNFKLLEINGAKAEPIHIYDPKLSWSQIVRDISFHWKTLFKIVKENSDQEVPTTAEGWKSFWSLKKAVNS